jgi:hypothetical protein
VLFVWMLWPWFPAVLSVIKKGREVKVLAVLDYMFYGVVGRLPKF